MVGTGRRVSRLGKRLVKIGGEPKWEILHYYYSDGGEVYEVHTLDTGHVRRFARRSDLDAWLKKAKGIR